MSSSIQVVGGSTAEAAEVTNNALAVRPRSDFEQAVEAGLAFSWANLTYDPDAADTILGVENNDPNRDLYIEQIMISCDTSSQFVVHTSSGVTMTSATTVTGVNLNRNSNTVALATAVADDTGNGQAAATYSGRLITGRVLANSEVVIDVGGAIVLPNDHNIGIDITTAATAANMTIIGYFKAKE